MNKYILLAITALCLQDMQAQTVVHPSIKTKTTFAIVVDLRLSKGLPKPIGRNQAFLPTVIMMTSD